RGTVAVLVNVDVYLVIWQPKPLLCGVDDAHVRLMADELADLVDRQSGRSQRILNDFTEFGHGELVHLAAIHAQTPHANGIVAILLGNLLAAPRDIQRFPHRAVGMQLLIHTADRWIAVVARKDHRASRITEEDRDAAL